MISFDENGKLIVKCYFCNESITEENNLSYEQHLKSAYLKVIICVDCFNVSID
jgi:hypothetical protein